MTSSVCIICLEESAAENQVHSALPHPRVVHYT